MSDELSIVQEAERSFEVAFVGRLKHGAFRRAAERLGSQSAIARAMDSDASTIGNWINLKKYPPFSEELDTKLIKVVGKGWHELWPAELRAQIDSRLNTLCEERTFYRDLRAQELLDHKEAHSQALVDKLAYAETQQRIKQVLSTLSYREREILKLRFGLPCGPEMSYEEVGKIFRVTRERIRQIEAKALRKMQMPSRAGKLVALLPQLDGPDMEDQSPRHESLKDKYLKE